MGGEVFGGVATNAALRKLKKQIVAEGVSDPAKIEENNYWKLRYGDKRYDADYVDQARGQDGNPEGWFPSLGQWSGYDPMQEDRGKTWFEADYGKPCWRSTSAPSFQAGCPEHRL